jgi:hypothetical protein
MNGGKMIDFANGSVLKLKPIDTSEGQSIVGPLLVDGERVTAAFKGGRDTVIFTDKRIITVNVQGLTGKKTDYSSLPFAKIQAFSVETAGTFDRDAELELYFSGLGKVKLEFSGSVDIRQMGRDIAARTL